MRAVASPAPVAAYLPEGETAQQRIGDEWPERVDEHRLTGRTLKIAWGSHRIVKTSSAEKDGSVKSPPRCARRTASEAVVGARMSAWSEVGSGSLIGSAGSDDVEGSGLGIRSENANGVGSS
jgi:hypothetical protein